MQEQIEFLKKYCKFQDYNCYVILAVARKKDNEGITGSQEVVFKEILYKQDHIERKYVRIYNQCKNYVSKKGKPLNFYIYLSVNSRDTKKCYWEFQRELITLNEEMTKGVDRQSQLARLDQRWLSVLMKPSTKYGRGYFMIDLDTKDGQVIFKVQKELSQNKYIGCTMIADRETKNGHHLIYEPFNKKLFEDWLISMELGKTVEIKPDDLMFLDRLQVDKE